MTAVGVWELVWAQPGVAVLSPPGSEQGGPDLRPVLGELWECLGVWGVHPFPQGSQ